MYHFQQSKLLPLQIAVAILTILIYPCHTKSIYELLAAPEEALQSYPSTNLVGAQTSESERLESAIQSYVNLEEAYLRGYIAALKNHQFSSPDEDIPTRDNLAELLRSASGSRLSKRSRSENILRENLNEEPLWLDRTGRIRRRRQDSHPVYLGFGQEAAGAAYDTFASMLEEGSGKRIEKSNRPNSSSNPVRFIG